MPLVNNQTFKCCPYPECGKEAKVKTTSFAGTWCQCSDEESCPMGQAYIPSSAWEAIPRKEDMLDAREKGFDDGYAQGNQNGIKFGIAAGGSKGENHLGKHGDKQIPCPDCYPSSSVPSNNNGEDDESYENERGVCSECWTCRGRGKIPVPNPCAKCGEAPVNPNHGDWYWCDSCNTRAFYKGAWDERNERVKLLETACQSKRKNLMTQTKEEVKSKLEKLSKRFDQNTKEQNTNIYDYFTLVEEAFSLVTEVLNIMSTDGDEEG